MIQENIIQEEKTIINRCLGYTKSNKKCRAKINKDAFFCCSSHEPYNIDVFEKGCFMCMEKIYCNSNDIIFFKCKHVIHRKCYDEWITFSKKNESPICIICRKEVYSTKDKKDDNNNNNNIIKNKKKVIINKNPNNSNIIDVLFNI